MRFTIAGSYFAVALAFGQVAALNERVADLTDAIDRKPDFASAYYARGVTYISLNKFAEAERDLTTAMALKTPDVLAYSSRAQAFAGLNRRAEEIIDLSEAIDLKPGNMTYRLRRANSYRAYGHCQLANQDYTDVLRVMPSVEAYQGRAACRKQLGDAIGATDDENGARELMARQRQVVPPQPVQPPPAPRAPIQQTPQHPPAPQQPPANPSGAYRIGAGVSAPMVLFKIEPEYSEEARKAKFQGSVMLSIVVDQYGEPQDIKVLRPLGMGLDQQAMDAVRRWVFKPGRKDGSSVAVFAQIEVSFHLL
jgi:TonB family protein